MKFSELDEILETAIFCLKFTGFIVSCCSIFSSTAISIYFTAFSGKRPLVSICPFRSLSFSRTYFLSTSSFSAEPLTSSALLYRCPNTRCSIHWRLQRLMSYSPVRARSWGMLRQGGEEELPSVSDVVKVVAMGVYVSCV